MKTMQEEIELGEQKRQRLRLAAEDAVLLQDLTFLDGIGLALQMLEGLRQEAASAAGGIEHGFAKLRIRDFHHEAHDRTRRIELTGIACGIAHLAQQGLVEAAER